MERLLLTKDLVALGYSGTEIETMVRVGELHRLRRGAYLKGRDIEAMATAREQHRQLVRATVGQSHDGAVVSHMSAAVLHGLPLWHDQLQRVQLIRDRRGGGRSRRHVVVRGMPLDPADVVDIDGIAVTSLARTVVDLACQLPMQRSVAVGDAALRVLAARDPAGAGPAELVAALDRARGRTGSPTARRAIAFLDARAESAGESVSRVVLHELGLPAPELQYEIVDENGIIVARTDFVWPDRRTVGEFDGQVKYSGVFGKTAEKVVLEEKRRENAIRRCGWEVARWTWPDLSRPDELGALLHGCFSRGGAG